MKAFVPPRLPGLELLRPIGRGAFGEVWLARTVTGQFRAVKLVPLGTGETGRQDLGERVFRGVQAYLDHLPPGSAAALAVLHVDRAPDGRFLYYVMELADDVAGGRDFAPEHYQALTLSEFRRRSPGQFVPAEETIRLGGKLAAGLAALHAAGLVHRDIKPNNVVFIGGEPRLADIDLVRPAEASLSVGGAQGYSPLEGPGRPTADVFSLARTLYVTVTGLPVGEFPRLPEDWDQRPDAPALQRLNAVLLRASDRDPAKRHPNAAALAEDFRRLERGEDVERDRTKRITSRRLAVTATALLALVALVVTLLIPAYRQRAKQAEFERYREKIKSAAVNLPHADWQKVTEDITRASESHKLGIEAEMLRRQFKDTQSATSATNVTVIPHGWPMTPIERLAFNLGGNRLAAWNGTKIYIHSLPDRRHLSTITNAAGLVGFVQPGDHIVGIGRESDGSKPICLWNSDTGVALPQRLPGNWIPGGILGDGQTVVVLPFSDRHRTLVRWMPLSGRPASSEVWNPAGERWWDVDGIGGNRPDKQPEPVALINQAGNRMVFKEYRYDYPKVELPNGKLAVEEGKQPISSTTITMAYFDRTLQRWEVNGSINYVSRRLANISMSASGEWLSSIDPMTQSGSLAGLWRPEAMTHSFTAVEAMAPSFDAQIVAVGGNGNQLILADGRTGSARALFEGHYAKVSALAWGNSDASLASGDKAGQIRIWNIPKPLSALLNQRTRVHRQARIVASIDESLLAVGAPTPNRITPNSVVFLLDGQNLQTHLWTTGPEVDDRDVAIIREIGFPLCLSPATNALWAISTDGRLVCETTSKRIIPPEKMNLVLPRVYLFETNVFTSSVTNATGLASPNHRRLVLFSERTLALWAVLDGSARRIAETVHPTGAHFSEAVISSDSRWAVVLAEDGSAQLADLDNGATRLLKQLNEKAVTACFRPDSTECYFGTSGGRLLRLDTATDDPPELLDANFGLPAHMIATPDGERLLTAGPGEQLGIRRLPDGAPIVQLTHHGLALEPGRHNLKRLLYLPKQQRVISLSEDGWLTQW